MRTSHRKVRISVRFGPPYPFDGEVRPIVAVEVNEGQYHFEILLDRFALGEAVVIERDGVAVAMLVRFRDKGKLDFGSMKGVIELDYSFYDPLPKTS